MCAKKKEDTERFRFSIKRETLKEELILTIPRSLGATEVWIDGELAATHGQLSKDGENEKIDGRPLQVKLPQEAVLDMLFLVSNHKHRLGGGFSLLNKIQDAQHFKKSKAKSGIIEGIITFLILIFGAYQIIQFFSLQKYEYFLYFGLFCIIGASRQLFVGEGLIYLFFPEIPFEFIQKMRYIGYYGGLLFLLKYHTVLFPNYIPERIVNSLVFTLLLGIVFVMVTPAYYGTFSAPIFQVLGFVIVILGCFQISNAIKDKRPYAWAMLVSMLVMCVFFVNDLLNATLIIQTEFLVNYGILFYVAFQIILNNRIQKQTAHKLIELSSHISSIEHTIDQKKKEIVQLRTETFQQAKSKEKLVENLKKVASKDDSVSIQNVIADLKSELTDGSHLLGVKKEIEAQHHEFIARIKELHPSLTKTDVEICVYIRLSLSQKEIAKLRFTSIDAVKKSRYRLRKKMNLVTTDNLENYLKSIQ